MNDEFNEIRRLIRLKRYEKPGDGYFEEFLTEFQKRQRSELLQRSAHSLLVERVGTYFSGIGRRGWIYAAGGAYAVVMLGMFAWPDAISEPAVAGSDPEATSPLWSDGTPGVAPVVFTGAEFKSSGIPDFVGRGSGHESPRRRRVVLPPSKNILPAGGTGEIILREY